MSTWNKLFSKRRASAFSASLMDAAQIQPMISLASPATLPSPVVSIIVLDLLLELERRCLRTLVHPFRNEFGNRIVIVFQLMPMNIGPLIAPSVFQPEYDACWVRRVMFSYSRIFPSPTRTINDPLRPCLRVRITTSSLIQ